MVRGGVQDDVVRAEAGALEGGCHTPGILHRGLGFVERPGRLEDAADLRAFGEEPAERGRGRLEV